MKKTINIKIIIIFMGCFLTGCSSMNSKFDCPNKPGVTCKSIDQVNDMVDRGMLGRDGDLKNSCGANCYPTKNSLTAFKMFNPANSLRSGEYVVRVWVSPYQDVQGNYHNQSTLYTVVRKNNWTVPKEVY